MFVLKISPYNSVGVSRLGWWCLLNTFSGHSMGIVSLIKRWMGTIHLSHYRE